MKMNSWIYPVLLRSILLISICFISGTTSTDTATIPSRTYKAFITGSDPRLNLSNSSLCFNSTERRELEFQRLLIKNDSIYVGATNHILQINIQTFTLSQIAVLGPYDDDETCLAPPICTSGCESLKCINNRIRLMLPHRDQLITCGSIYAGTCDILNLKNVAQPYEPAPTDSDLKCQTNSQITKHADDLAVASIFINASDATRDLFYVGAAGPVETFFPPDSGVSNPSLTFTKIDQTSTYTSIESGKRKFVSSWTSSTHSFMLWTTVNTGQSYISRLCHNTLNEFERSRVSNEEDRGFGRSSYTETTISCDGYTQVTLAYQRYGKLFAIFTNNVRYILCSVGQSKINGHIVDARQSCFEGKADKASYVDENQTPCKELKVTDRELNCGLPQDKSHFLKPVRCKLSLEFQTEFRWPVATNPPTTIAVDLVNGFTSGFFGTDSGEIWKAKLGVSATDFVEKIVLEEGGKVLHDVGFDTLQHLYAMTSNKIFKVNLSNCNQYNTCSSCLTSSDPYCGWCVLQNACTQKSECEMSTIHHWMKIDVPASQCPHVSVVEPNALSVAASQELSLTFGGNSLPSYEYQCEFAVADGVLSTSQLYNLTTTPNCMSPPTSPDIPEGQDYVEVTLRVLAGNAVVATGSFNIYDCTKIPSIQVDTMCTSCVSSRWNCNWCLSSNTCNDNCILPDTAIPGHTDCAAVLWVFNNTEDIPVGKAHEFVLETGHLPETMNFVCVVEFCNSPNPLLVPGVRDGVRVKCNVGPNKLNCEEQVSNIRISLRSGDYVVDTLNVDDVTVGLFNCTGRHAECGLCMGFRDTHNECAWCVGVQTCIPHGDCIDGSQVTNITSCPSPAIERFNPSTGPTDGGTEISLIGSNLGSRADEISSVTIGGEEGSGVQCRILPNKYVPSKQVVCETQASGEYPGGRVRIQMTYSGDDVISKDEFTFKQVELVGFEPTHALNGTNIKIFGNNLDIGNGVTITVTGNGEKLTSYCDVRNREFLTCPLPEVKSTGSYTVVTSLDGFKKRMAEKVEYVEPPSITELVGRSNLISFESGGLSVTFQMSSLLGIQKIFLEVVEGEKSEDCKLNQTTSSVTCLLPPREKAKSSENFKRYKRMVPVEDTKKSAGPSPTQVSAEMVINDRIRLSLEGEEFSLSYVADPTIQPLTLLPCRPPETMTPQTRQNDDVMPGNETDDVKAPDDTPTTSDSMTAIQLSGTHLDSAATKEDYTVLIVPLDGESEPINCATNFLESESLICRAPASVLRKYEGVEVQVKVLVGNLSFTLPSVKYCPKTENGLSVIVIGVTMTIVAILVIIIVGLVIRNRQRAKKQQKEREQIMLMLDTLENKTRETARKAYFELQLGYMTKLTDNLSEIITYNPPVSCFMRALFNDWKPDHPMLSSKTTNGMSSTMTSGLDDFIQLLKNRDFLILLIKTLEEQKHFTVKEKGHFASLLTVCLFDDLVYFTSIMMELLSELIQRHVSKNPKLLLRRSESVVEKMVSHWLCINLYSQCIREQAGKPLFLLTKAIHFLVSSAPSDVVANKALNSLNEMTLLGTEVTYEVITLRASVVEKGEKSEIIDVKVVNCDTITQVKIKIIEAVYRDRPFSECPKPDDMELELKAGQSHIVLSDIDNMSFQDGNYTQINTLKHYNVPHGAEVSLSPAKQATVQVAENGNAPTEKKQKRRLYHLINPRETEGNGFVEEDDTGGNKTKAIIGNLINQPFQEIYLTRMVKSKTTVQEYVDGVFNAILKPNPKSRAVKYFFQFLDREAAKHKINDPEVVHIWKTNSLLLRYWVNILKNPEFLFDVNKTMIVDSCLNVITQAFMDACTTTNHKLGQDSPSNKLLYAKDAERYREMVSKFFVDISSDDPMSEDEINESLMEISKEYAVRFNKRAAAQQLFNHLDRYRSQVQQAVAFLTEDEVLAQKLSDIINKLSPDTNGKDAGMMV